MGEQGRFFKNITAKAFSLGVNLLISFFLTPYIIAHVGSESYGFLGLANDFIDVARIVSVALNSMALRFIAVSLHRGDEAQANRYFSSVMLANMLLCLLLLVPFGAVVAFLDRFLRISQDILTDVRLLWSLLFLNFFLSVLGSAYAVALFAKNRVDKESMRSAEAIGLRALFLIGCYTCLAPKVWYVGASSCLLTAYVLATNFYYTKKYFPRLSVSKKTFDKKAVKTLFCAGGWNCLTKVSTIFTTGLDLVLLNLFVGQREMGVAALSKTLPNTLLSVFVLLASVFLPRMTEDYAKKNHASILSSTVFSVKLLGLLACVPLTLLAVYGKSFYQLWTPSENAAILWQLSLLGSCAFFLSLSTQNLWNLFTVTNRVKVAALGQFITACLSIFTVLICMTLVKSPLARTFLIIGTSAVYQLLMTACFLPFAAARCFSFSPKPFWGAMGATLGLTAMVIGLFAVLNRLWPASTWRELIAWAVAICITTAATGFWLLLKKEDRKKLWAFLRQK